MIWQTLVRWAAGDCSACCSRVCIRDYLCSSEVAAHPWQTSTAPRRQRQSDRRVRVSAYGLRWSSYKRNRDNRPLMNAALQVAAASGSHGSRTRSPTGAARAEWPARLRVAPEALFGGRKAIAGGRGKASSDGRRAIARPASDRRVLSGNGGPPSAGERGAGKDRDGGLADHVRISCPYWGTQHFARHRQRISRSAEAEVSARGTSPSLSTARQSKSRLSAIVATDPQCSRYADIPRRTGREN